MAVRPGDVLRSLAFYAAFYVGTIFCVLAAVFSLLLGRRIFMATVDSWTYLHRFCVTRLLGIEVSVQGELPREGALIAMKHESFFEAIDLPVLFFRPVVFAKVELLRIPLWGLAARTYGLVPVERAQGARALRAMISAARAKASEGRVFVIFPEGTRVAHGARPPLQAGFAGLYKLLNLPVVPVAVDSGPLYHRRWKRKGTITVRAGAPIPPGLPRGEIEARVHEGINALNAEAGSDRVDHHGFHVEQGGSVARQE
ncbi:MAG: 1-acyl-sn-glycerol-3-phosphate acyltransferase [Novosphingobium sp.]|nr:1-acyl-sn-glycerol-3-phosphate acyltransferase [Novosphingobium sp.]MCP5401836.1 1-acyl-sn-glycerol-3-phosphate acyltransferase [Novosphingobium sp.]